MFGRKKAEAKLQRIMATRRKNISEAADLAFDSIEAILRPYMLSGNLIQIFESDPYATGYISARMPFACGAASKELGLPREDVQTVYLAVSNRVYGTEEARRQMAAHADSLFKADDPDFKLGYARANKLSKYTTLQEDISSDPDFPKAMEIASSIGLPMSNDIAVPVTGLERIWFGSHMEKHL